jgi:hypothetical protein
MPVDPRRLGRGAGQHGHAVVAHPGGRRPRHPVQARPAGRDRGRRRDRPGLVGADPDLDRTAAIAWPPRRAAHVVVAGAAVTGILTATALTGDPLTQAGPIARNVAGLGGLVALGAATLGAARAWLLPLTWTVLLVRYTPPFGIPPTGPAYKVMLTWLVQPPGTAPANVAAVLLAAAGTLAYALFSTRR